MAGRLDPSSARVEIIVELARHRLADAGCPLEILQRRALDRPRRAEVHQQRPFAVGADAGDFVEASRSSCSLPASARCVPMAKRWASSRSRCR